jgi:hypothetical protein
MRKSRSSGSVGERGGNDPLYPENKFVFPNFDFSSFFFRFYFEFRLSIFRVLKSIFYFPILCLIFLVSSSNPGFSRRANIFFL